MISVETFCSLEYHNAPTPTALTAYQGTSGCCRAGSQGTSSSVIPLGLGGLEILRHSHLQGFILLPAFMNHTLQHTGQVWEAPGCVAGGPRHPLVTVPFLFLGQKEMAKLKHQYSIDELRHREAQMQFQLETEKAHREKLAEHKVLRKQLAYPRHTSTTRAPCSC